MSIFKVVTGAVFALGFAAGAAQANVINFETDEAGHVVVDTSITGDPTGPYSGPSSNFTIHADTFTGSVPGSLSLNNETNIRITQGIEGIGVNNRNCSRFQSDICDNGEIDGARHNDILIFSFDTDMLLSRIVFERVDRFDDFVFYVPGANPEAQEFDIVNPFFFPDTNGDEGYFDFSDRQVTSFGIGARGSYDNFLVSRIEIAPVPLPAGAVLLLGGLAAFGVARRRQRRAA